MKLILSALFLTLTSPAFAQGWLPLVQPASTGTMLYERLNIGMGGYNTSLDIANDGTRVTYSDISNGYVMPVAGTTWKPCVTGSTMPTPPGLGYNAYGVTSMAIAKNNSQRMYMFYAPADGINPPTYLFSSNDQCDSWQLTDFPVSAGPSGVGSNRIIGQMIAVDPNNEDIVYLNHAVHGTMRSVDGGACFEAVLGIPASANPDGYGGMGLAIDEYSGTTTLTGTCDGNPYSVTASQNVYIPVWSMGVWASTDGGNTFAPIAEGGPTITKNVTTTVNDTVLVVTGQVCRGFHATGVNDNGLGLTWTAVTTNRQLANGACGSWRISQFYAIVPTPITGHPISVEFNGGTSGDALPAASFVPMTGVNLAAPFDSGGGSTVPRSGTANPITGVTTNNADTLLFATVVIQGPSSAPSGGSGSWTSVFQIANNYVAYSQVTSAQSSISVTYSGATTVRGGLVSAIRAASPGSITVDVAEAQSGAGYDAGTTPYQITNGQMGCNGIYYVAESESGVQAKGWKFDWSGPTWTLFVPGTKSLAPMHNLASPDCARVDIIGGSPLQYARSTNSGDSWPVVRDIQGAATNQAAMSSPDVQWFEYTDPGFAQNVQTGDAMYNPATGNLEISTGFGYFIVNGGMPTSGVVTFNALVKGGESTVPTLVGSIPGGNNYFANRDVGIFPNLNTTTWPANGLPIRNYSSGGLVQCTDIQYSGLNPSYVFAVCGYDLENSGYTTNGGITRADWTRFGKSNNGYSTSFMPPGTAPSGGAIAPNACDPNNVLFSQASTSGRNWRTENALTQHSSFTGSVTSNILNVTIADAVNPILPGQEIYLTGGSAFASQGTRFVVEAYGTAGTTGTGGTGTYSLVGTYGNIASRTLYSSVHWVLIAPTDYTPNTSATVPYGWGHGTIDAVNFKRHPLAADKVNCDTFYAYNSGTTRTYKSTDKGVTWASIASTVPGGSLCEQGYLKLETVHGKAGWVYATAGFGLGAQPNLNCRLQWLRDDGVSASGWNSCPDLTEVFMFSMGAAAPSGGSGNPTVFALGYNGSTSGLWRSNDDCQTWTNILINGGQPTGDRWSQFASVVGGDMNEYGTVYLGFNPGSGFTRGRLQ